MNNGDRADERVDVDVDVDVGAEMLNAFVLLLPRSKREIIDWNFMIELN
jgi:hypothetical protein